MDFEVVENEIVACLVEKVADDNVNIIAIPETESEILPPAGKRQIIVAFAAEDADPDSNMSFVQQDTSLTFTVLLQGKLLRGDKGLYKLAEMVKQALQGFVPTDGREMTYNSHKFIKNDKNVFEYALDFKTESTILADTAEPEAVGSLNEVTYYTNEKV